MENKSEKAAEELKKKRIAELQRDYIRIGDVFYKEVHTPDKFGRTYKQYSKRAKSTINDDFWYGATKHIKKYDGFCTVPEHINYQSEVRGHFNKYVQLSHKPAPGDFPTIRKVLDHIFEEKVVFIMDYLHLLYAKPAQRLPIILLESKERNTGKSTFGALLNLIFQDNAIKMGNSDFESDFNGFWISKLCVIVDETSLNKDGVMQNLKRLTTETGKVVENAKGKEQSQVDFFAKFIFMSNDEGKALPIERGENRFAVFKVRTFKEKGIADDPNIEEKMASEIPAFLHHLAQMKPTYPESGRLYFSPHLYHTKQLDLYFEGAKSPMYSIVREFIADSFKMFDKEEVISYSINDIMNQLSLGNYTKKIDRKQIKMVLENELSLRSERVRYVRFNLYNAESGGPEMHNSVEGNSWVYKFERDNFLP